MEHTLVRVSVLRIQKHFAHEALACVSGVYHENIAITYLRNVLFELSAWECCTNEVEAAERG